MIRGALALALSRLTGRQDVIFGTVVSGRPIEFPGADTVAGFLAKTIPVRVKIPSDLSVATWLKDLHHDQLTSQRHDDLPLKKILSETPFASPPFDTLLLIGNLSPSQSKEGSSVHLKNYASAITSSFPLTITVTTADSWMLSLFYHSHGFQSEWIESFIDSFHTLLTQLALHPHSNLHQVIEGIDFPSLPEKSSLSAPEFEGPRSQSELDLVDLWQEVFKKELSVHDDFFALGGSSFLAVKLATEIERRFEVRLPVSSIAKYPTVRSMIEFFEERGVRSKEPVRGNSGIYLFIPAGTGEILYFTSLEASPDGSLSLSHEMRAKQVTANYDATSTITDLARRFIVEMRLMQPQGPLLLATRNCGTTVAYEIAQQLYREQDPLGAFIVVDFGPPPLPILSPQIATRYSSLILTHIRKLEFIQLAKRIKKTLSFRITGIRNQRKRIAKAQAHIPEAFYYPDAIAAYLPKPYPGNITLFASDAFRQSDEGNRAISLWRELTGDGLEVIEIQGDVHPNIFEEPHLQTLHENLPKFFPDQNAKASS